MNSLFIPQPEIKLTHVTKASNIRLHNLRREVARSKLHRFIRLILREVKQVLGEGVYLSENEFRKNEYHYLLNEYQYLLNTGNFTSEEKDLILEEILLNDELKKFRV